MKVGTTKVNLYSSSEIKADATKKGKTKIVPVYEVSVSNESGSTATFYFTRDAHRGQSDGCLLCIGSGQFESTEEGITIDKTNLESNSSGSQKNFMSKIKAFQKEDKDAKKGDDIKVVFDKVEKSSTSSDTSTKTEEKK